MPRIKKSEEAEIAGDATLDTDSDAGASAPASDGVMYWSPQSASLVLAGRNGHNVAFAEHVALAKDGGAAHAVLESHSSKGKDYYRVYDKAGTADEQKQLLKFLRNLVESDGMDEVSPERGYIAVSRLFTARELDELGITYSTRDVDALLLAAINHKTIEGI